MAYAGPWVAHIQLDTPAALHQPLDFVASLDGIPGGIGHGGFRFIQTHSQQLLTLGSLFAQHQRCTMFENQLQFKLLMSFALIAPTHPGGQETTVFHYRP